MSAPPKPPRQPALPRRVPPLLDDAYTLAKWLCRNPADAEDIVQEAAMRALKALETTSVERPKAWFLAIVRNAAITWMARNRPKDVAFAGDSADLEALDPRLGEPALDPEAPYRARGRRTAPPGDRCPAVAVARDPGPARDQRALLSRHRRGDRRADRHRDVAPSARPERARKDA